MSDYEIALVVFGAITTVISMIKLVIYIADKFSKRK